MKNLTAIMTVLTVMVAAFFLMPARAQDSESSLNTETYQKPTDALSSNDSNFSKENFTTDFKTRVIAPKKTEAEKSEQKQSDDERKKDEEAAKLKELVETITGAWALVTTADKQLTPKLLETAVQRCLVPMSLKNLQFENEATKILPDVDGLFGDIIYFPTEAGLQRLDVQKGQVLLIQNVIKQRRNNETVIWGLSGKNIKLPVRFANRVPGRPKLRLMLEETRLLLRCPFKDIYFETGN